MTKKNLTEISSMAQELLDIRNMTESYQDSTDKYILTVDKLEQEKAELVMKVDDYEERLGESEKSLLTWKYGYMKERRLKEEWIKDAERLAKSMRNYTASGDMYYLSVKQGEADNQHIALMQKMKGDR